MRLIDADVLIKDLRELLYTDENPSKQLTEAGQAIHNAAIALAASEVMDAPAIDAAPVVHARWELIHEWEHIPDDPEVEERCSSCGCYDYRYKGQPQNNYCPNCGTKMDEKEDA